MFHCISCEESNNLTNIFSKQIYCDMIKLCFDVEVSPKDGPKHICSDCAVTLRNALEFKCQLLNTLNIDSPAKDFKHRQQMNSKHPDMHTVWNRSGDKMMKECERLVFKNESLNDNLLDNIEYIKAESDNESEEHLDELLLDEENCDIIEINEKQNVKILGLKTKTEPKESSTVHSETNLNTSKKQPKKVFTMEDHRDRKKINKPGQTASDEFENYNSLSGHNFMRHNKNEAHCCALCKERFNTASEKHNHLNRVHGLQKPYSYKHSYKTGPNILPQTKSDDDKTLHTIESTNNSSKEGLDESDLLEEHLDESLWDEPNGRTNSPKSAQEGNGILEKVQETNNLETSLYESKKQKRHILTDKKRQESRKIKKPYTLRPDQTVCDICGMDFVVQKSLITHMHVHYPNFKCPDCGKTFAVRHSLTSHRKCHRKGPFRCEICNKVFKTYNTLTGHNFMTHTTKKPYGCRMCKQRFKSIGERDNHQITVHRLQKEYKCFYCDEKFYTATKRSRHSRLRHFNVRYLHCKDCDKSYSHKDDLNQHLAMVHGIGVLKQYECDICQAKMISLRSLKVHMKKHAEK